MQYKYLLRMVKTIISRVTEHKSKNLPYPSADIKYKKRKHKVM